MTTTQHVSLTLPDVPHYDWERLHAHWVPGDPYRPEVQTPGYYRAKAQVAAWIQPERVVEIGVRAGYSALAFHMGHPFRRYYGLDLDAGTWGGEKGFVAHAETSLQALPNVRVVIQKADSQTLGFLPKAAKNADLFHVDGDHSYAGAMHDIILALGSGAHWILVDDYDYIRDVQLAADRLVEHLQLTAYHVGDGGYRGNLLIRGNGRT